MSTTDFEARVAPHREELRAYCYRMLGSLQDAEDAVQEAMLGAWKGLPAFEGRSSLRSWLYRVATHACFRVIEQRPKRVIAAPRGPCTQGLEVDPLVDEPIWLEPYPEPPGATYELKESIELAFVAALQHLPPVQRAALMLREVMGFSAVETAELLETTVASVNSAVQRARETVERRIPPVSQQATLRNLGEGAERALVEAFIAAWEKGDAGALARLLVEDAKFTMPPIPTWFQGRDAIGHFFAERVFAAPWRLVPLRASGQLAFACYHGPDFALSALNVVTVRGPSISEMTGFLDPAVHARFGLRGR